MESAYERLKPLSAAPAAPLCLWIASQVAVALAQQVDFSTGRQDGRDVKRRLDAESAKHESKRTSYWMMNNK